jgi:anti-sigma regulatory factor (Ser/Thr protein kinase)
VPISRATVRAFLNEVGVPPSRVDGILLVVSELVTNGVIHDGGDDIVLRVDGEDHKDLKVEVVTADRLPDQMPYDRKLVAREEAGRGLLIVDAFSDEVVTNEVEGRRETMCLFRGGHH